jgi:ribonuclease VapC
MIVADSSVIVAIMRRESDADVWIDVIDKTRTLMSVVSFVETSMVISGRRLDADAAKVEDTLRTLGVSIVPVSLDQGAVARTAFMRFGKGRHSAALNIADCFIYALAKSRDLPLLFKGDDFSKTDIVPAWRP